MQLCVRHLGSGVLSDARLHSRASATMSRVAITEVDPFVSL
jgi:hypothetical protein